MKEEEIYWGQRSRALWLKDGDRNTPFFHNKASNRKQRNSIFRIRDKDGLWVDEEKEVAGVLTSFFKDLFSSDGISDMHGVLDSVEAKVTVDMNGSLTWPYTKEEVKRALMQMHPTKSPGPDGMPPLFFQKFWNIIEFSFVNTCLDILNNGMNPSSLNLTYIVLIPKVKAPENPKDFRPISLCNVILRVVTKTIANRLKHSLDLIISPTQSAFILGRSIVDSAMIAFEIFHYMKKKKSGKHGYLALKLDMSKAYDRVEWNFLHAMCFQLGFDHSWIDLVMRCVTTVRYSILLNGQPTESFSPRRGLRQGDPPSPYLFLLCAEGFSALIRKAENRGSLTGIRIARNAPPISHLFFADDNVLFFKSSQEEVDVVKGIIATYKGALGQKANMDKSKLFASRNLDVDTKNDRGRQLGARTVEGYSKYLGLLTLLGRSKKRVFQVVADKVFQRLKGWKERSLTKAGREVLIKAVIQAIPTYAMSCFLFPHSLC